MNVAGSADLIASLPPVCSEKCDLPYFRRVSSKIGHPINSPDTGAFPQVRDDLNAPLERSLGFG